MKLPSRKTLLANAACLLLLAWLYGGDLLDGLRARDAEVSAFTVLPSVNRPAGVLVLGVLALGGVVWGLMRRRGDEYKGYRLLPILLVGALFVDLVVAESRMPLGSTDLATMSLQYFHQLAQEQATQEAVSADPALLRPLLDKLGRPPYLVRGQPLQGYTLQVREGCEGPVRSAPGIQPGTFIYCVAPGRKGAWLTLVGLPAERRFGEPDVLSVGGEVRFLLVRPIPPDTDTPDTPPPVQEREEGEALPPPEP